MSAKETGGPAFPGLIGAMTGIDSDGIERWETEASGGMTLRDYFASKALPMAWAANVEDANINGKQGSRSEIADIAYSMADAMLEARK